MSIIAQFLGFQSSKNQKSSPSRKDRALARNNAWSRKDNLIVVDIGYVYGPDPIEELAHGLAKLGHRVLVVNALSLYPDNGRSQPVSIPLKNSSGEIYAWSPQYSQQNFVKCMDEFVEIFDYVIVDADSDCMDEKTKKLLGHALTRLIVSSESTIDRQWKNAPEVRDRSFLIAHNEKPAFLYMNILGVPDGFVEDMYGAKPAFWESVTIPVIASCHRGLDQVEFARAILGAGNPLRVYATQKNLNIKRAMYGLAYPREDLIGVTFIMLTLVYGVAFCLTIPLGVPLWTAHIIPGIAAIVGGSIPWFRYRFRKGHINPKSAQVKEIYAAQNEANFLAVAPPLGEISTRGAHGEFVPISMVAWKKSEQAYLSVKERWVEYELDVFKMLDAPLLLDYSCAETRTLAEAMKRSEQALEESKIADESTAPRLRREFSETVSALEIAFKVAEDNALRQGISYLDAGEQVKVRRARDLLGVAQNAGASDSEREVSYKQAMKNLKGIIVITDTTQKKILESAGQRKTITS
jgi:hypothetical protein